MSMFAEIGRFGAAMRRAHSARRSRVILNRLPADIQKDIGWPVNDKQESRHLHHALLSSGR